MKKTIITVVGNDTVGIIAKVCTYLADNNVNNIWFSGRGTLLPAARFFDVCLCIRLNRGR